MILPGLGDGFTSGTNSLQETALLPRRFVVIDVIISVFPGKRNGVLRQTCRLVDADSSCVRFREPNGRNKIGFIIISFILPLPRPRHYRVTLHLHAARRRVIYRTKTRPSRTIWPIRFCQWGCAFMPELIFCQLLFITRIGLSNLRRITTRSQYYARPSQNKRNDNIIRR